MRAEVVPCKDELLFAWLRTEGHVAAVQKKRGNCHKRQKAKEREDGVACRGAAFTAVSHVRIRGWDVVETCAVRMRGTQAAKDPREALVAGGVSASSAWLNAWLQLAARTMS